MFSIWGICASGLSGSFSTERKASATSNKLAPLKFGRCLWNASYTEVQFGEMERVVSVGRLLTHASKPIATPTKQMTAMGLIGTRLVPVLEVAPAIEWLSGEELDEASAVSNLLRQKVTPKKNNHTMPKRPDLMPTWTSARLGVSRFELFITSTNTTYPSAP